jgi:predicted small metal-binding protein
VAQIRTDLPSHEEVDRLEYTVECDCGWSCRGSEEEVIAACREHGREVHGLELSDEQVLAVAQRVVPARDDA